MIQNGDAGRDLRVAACFHRHAHLRTRVVRSIGRRHSSASVPHGFTASRDTLTTHPSHSCETCHVDTRGFTALLLATKTVLLIERLPPPPTCEYELALVDEAGMRETRFVSYSGPYSLGDRLPPDEQGRESIVIAVEETNGVERLVCEPAPQASYSSLGMSGRRGG